MGAFQRLSACVCLTLIITAAGFGAASASATETSPVSRVNPDTGVGDESVVGGGGIGGPGLQIAPAAREQASAKQAVADAYLAAKRGEASPAAYKGQLRAYAHRYGLEAGSSLQRDSMGDPATWAGNSLPHDESIELLSTSSKVLSVNHFGQINGYFCGPAAGKMIVHYMGDGDSAFNGASQTQKAIGGKEHMRTWINDATHWKDDLFRIGLNKWRQGKADAYYVSVDTPSVSKFLSSLTFDVDYGFPMAADTVELAGGTHYNGHPVNQTVGHWVVAHGYYGDGASTRFADSSTSVWSAPNAHFTYDTSNFVSRFLWDNGITW